MELNPIAKLVSVRGLDSFNASMFTKEQTQEILKQVSDIFFRQGRFGDGIRALEMASLPLPEKELREYADKLMIIGKHKEAFHILSKIGDEQMAAFVRANFL